MNVYMGHSLPRRRSIIDAYIVGIWLIKGIQHPLG